MSEDKYDIKVNDAGPEAAMVFFVIVKNGVAIADVGVSKADIRNQSFDVIAWAMSQMLNFVGSDTAALCEANGGYSRMVSYQVPVCQKCHSMKLSAQILDDMLITTCEDCGFVQPFKERS